MRLAWKRPGAKAPLEEALDAARAADVVLFAGGLTGDVEGEEMPVSYAGFAGGDRTDIALPQSQQALLQALHATGKPVVVILMGGSALGIEWAEQHVPAILMAWYPGQQGGAAIADVLFGDVSPSGRLPVTFYKSVDQLPPFSDYSMKGRTYRFFAGEPLYPFGYGLSYTRFAYSNLRLSRQGSGWDQVDVSVDVTNAGTRSGHEVVQLYVRPIAPKVPMPTRDLRGFERLLLQPGERRTVVVPAADLGDDGLLRRSSERLHGGAGTVPRSASAHRAATSARRRGSSSAPTLLGGRFVPARDMGQRNRSRARIAVTASRLRRARTAARERAETRVLPECGRSRRSEMAAPVD